MALKRSSRSVRYDWKGVGAADLHDFLDFANGFNKGNRIGRQTRVPGQVLPVLLANGRCRGQPAADQGRNFSQRPVAPALFDDGLCFHAPSITLGGLPGTVEHYVSKWNRFD